MGEQCKSFQAMLCHMYIIFLMAILPIYMGNGYYFLGDSKYCLFRNATLFCLGAWLFVAMISLLQRGKKDYKLSMMDAGVICYGMISFISAISSQYMKTALLGYRDWYMGALSQLLFVGIYFMISRSMTGHKISILIGEAGTLAVLLIALLQKLEMDPFRLLRNYNNGDWEYSHMISTIGNINWFSGYLGLVLPFAVTGYLYGKKKWKLCFSYLITVLGMVMLVACGSTAGIGISVLIGGFILWFGAVRPECLWKVFTLGSGVCFGLWMLGQMIVLRKSELTLPADGNPMRMMTSPIWWLAGIFFLALTVAFIHWNNKKWNHEKWNNNIRKKWYRRTLMCLFVFFGVLTLVIGGIWIKGHMQQDSQWGNGRSELWRLAGEQFLRCGVKEKLVGIGPDCFAEEVFTRDVSQDGHWEGVVYANAHNEWLNQLVNIGLFGMLSYIAVFVCGAIRYKRILLGVMVIGIYAMVATFSFQEVLNAPFLFMVLGMCESRMRKFDREEKEA